MGCMTIDVNGNHHAAAGPHGGQFISRAPSRPESSLIDGAARPVRSWRDDEPLATAYDSDIVADFERVHGPGGDIRALREFVRDMPATYDVDANERRAAVSALTARMAAGQAGLLVDGKYLHPGDRIDLSRLWSDDVPADVADWASSTLAILADQPSETHDGQLVFRLANHNRPVVTAAGTVFAVAAVRWRGRDMTETECADGIIATGALSSRMAGEQPHVIIAEYTRLQRASSTPDAPEALL